MNEEYIHSVRKPLRESDADTHQRRYGKDMRIRVSESNVIPSLTRETGGVILNINTDLSFENIEEFIGDQFLPGERDQAFSLWADDETKRTFTPIAGTTDFFIDAR
jgi:hypothetical protein